MKAFIILLFSLIATTAYSSEVRLELFTGTAFSLPSEVSVRQDGYPEVSKTAHWSTRPLEPAPYYSARIGLWEEERGIEIEMLHHKLYMDNTDEVFRNYRSTFGFNFFLLNKAWQLESFILRAGVGPIISHPINNIRGQEYTSSVTYKLVGAGTQVALQGRQKLYKKLYITEEAKITYGFANLPISGGDSSLTNTAFHILVGLSYSF